MRKFSGIIILIPIVLATLLFFVLLNISSLLKQDTLKNILKESGFYETAALYIKNDIVAKSDLQLNEGKNFEDLNAQVSKESVQSTIDNAIDKIFQSASNSSSAKIVPVEFSSQVNEGSTYYFEKNINLSDNLLFDLFTRRNTFLIVLAASILLLLFLGMLAYSSKSADWLTFFGLFGIISAISLAVTIFLLKEYAPYLLDQLITKSNLVQDPKLFMGLKRIASTLVDHQVLFYVAESIGLTILGALAFVGKRMITAEELGEIDKKI